MYEFGVKGFYDKSRLKSQYDAIIIGAGIGGLICGAFLAKADKKVLILEQHSMPGGYCTSFKRKGFIFDSAVHHIGGCGKWSIVGRCFSELDIDLDFYHLDPMDNIIFPSHSIEIPADIDDYKANLQAKFPDENENIAKFFKELIKLYWSVINNKENSPLVNKYKDLTYKETLNSFFTDPKLKAILAGQWGYIGSVPDKVSTIGMCQMMINYLKDGAYFPAGGTQEIANAILKRFIDLGGEILLSSKVSKILTVAGKASGVVLDGGKKTFADIIVSNVDAKQTFQKLLQPELNGEFASKLNSMKESISFFLLYLGVDAEVELGKLKRGFYYETDEPFVKDNWKYISVPTEVDSSLAPENKQIIFTLVSLENGYDEVENWEEVKAALTESTIDYLEKYVPDLRNHIVVVDAATPKTLERYTLNSKGAAYGWAVTNDQTGDNRLQHETPVKGLYLAGHWTNPGPGVSSVISSGWKTANIILKDIN